MRATARQHIRSWEGHNSSLNGSLSENRLHPSLRILSTQIFIILECRLSNPDVSDLDIAQSKRGLGILKSFLKCLFVPRKYVSSSEFAPHSLNSLSQLFLHPRLSLCAIWFSRGVPLLTVHNRVSLLSSSLASTPDQQCSCS